MKLHLHSTIHEFPADMRIHAEFPEGMHLRNLQILIHKGRYVMAVDEAKEWEWDDTIIEASL
jgi:hypothetical protein